MARTTLLALFNAKNPGWTMYEIISFREKNYRSCSILEFACFSYEDKILPSQARLLGAIVL